MGWAAGCLATAQGSWWPAGRCETTPPCKRNRRSSAGMNGTWPLPDHAKGRAFDLMTFVFGALMVSFALMEVDLAALLLLVFAYLFVEGYAVYCRCKYEKEM